MKTFLIIVINLTLCIISFWGGYELRKYNLGATSRYILKTPIHILDNNGSSVGKLPEGTYFYETGDNKQNTYYIFVTVDGKTLEVLKPAFDTKIFNLVAPLNAELLDLEGENKN